MSTKQSRRAWRAEEKLRILQEAREAGMPVSEVCRRHGISPGQFYAWERRAHEGALSALQRRSPKKDGEAVRLQERISELTSVVTELITENLRLKKGRWP
jgi:transposase-like protein